MVIGVDGNEANVRQRVGVSVYVFNLLTYFRQKASTNCQFKIYLKHPPLTDLPPEKTNYQYQIVPGAHLWTQIFLPFHLYRKRGLNIFFSPAHYSPRFTPVPLIVTIHDLAFVHFPNDFLKKDLFQLNHWTRYSVKTASKIIAVSQSTKRDLINFYHVPEDKITVIYNGFEKKLKFKTSLYKLKNINRPYILYVGTIQPRKNIIMLLEAFSKFNRIYPEFELILAGKKGWLYQSTFEAVDKLGLTTSVYFTDYISDQQLVFLYRNAFCFVSPSLYEGFGLPILEAMSFDCPVICSSVSSLPEIGGDACLYIDPKNSSDLLEKLLKLKNSPQLREQLILQGRERVKLFSWKNCAEKTLALLKSMATNK